MNWKNYHSYRVFDEFIEGFVMQKRSYITKQREILDFDAAFDEIHKRYVDAFDASESTFDAKARRQFAEASRNTKLVFSNLEYLWCMPVSSIMGETKRTFALRWFEDGEVIKGDRYFFSGRHGIANPGMWHLTNKYSEILSLCRIFKSVIEDSSEITAEGIKDRIEKLAYEAIYSRPKLREAFSTKNKCSSYHMLLHLAAPDRYESIVSENHKDRIASVFAHVLEDEVVHERERQIVRIRELLFDTYGIDAESDLKRRSFFYLDEVKGLWIGKKSKLAQKAASVTAEILEEEAAEDWEGDLRTSSGNRLKRSAKLVRAAKMRDQFTCVACRFHFKDQIVQAHHLDPISERKQPKMTKLEDLITLCPTCHYIAHFCLRESPRYKAKDVLVVALKKRLPAVI